jgi:hypothetical protein
MLTSWTAIDFDIARFCNMHTSSQTVMSHCNWRDPTVSIVSVAEVIM